MNRTTRWLLSVGLLLVVTTMSFAQRGGGFRRRGFDPSMVEPEMVDRGGVPVWESDRQFKSDLFTFARVKYSSHGGGGWGRGGGNWATDFPDSDLNFSYRLQELTSLEVDPYGKIVELTDEKLFDYPFLYLIEPGRMELSDAEVAGLRRYLLNGGFLMFDDFWGDSAWQNVEREMKRVLPERSFVETSLDHPIYHCVFEIKAKGQVPNVRTGEESQYTGVTWENHDGDTQTVHHRAITDDKGRLMVFATHNTDNGDGWEREGEYEYYFKNFSEKIAYPLGINIIFYVMTH